jgi:hypothetical protein
MKNEIVIYQGKNGEIEKKPTRAKIVQVQKSNMRKMHITEEYKLGVILLSNCLVILRGVAGSRQRSYA